MDCHSEQALLTMQSFPTALSTIVFRVFQQFDGLAYRSRLGSLAIVSS